MKRTPIIKNSIAVESGSLLVALLLGAALAPPALAADLYVPSEHATIQAAVNAASSGDTIHIAAGNYSEQILIAYKNLTLEGEPGAAIHAITSMGPILTPYGDPDAAVPLVGIARSDVVLTGLTFDGERLGAAFGARQLRGIYLLGAGGAISNCTLRGFRGANLTRVANANAINSYNAVSLGSPVVNIGVFDCIFSDNFWGLHLRGDTVQNPTLVRTTFTIEGNAITGVGSTATTFAHGIVLRHGAAGDVRGNVITGHSYNGTNEAYASGISALDGRASVHAPPGYWPLQPVRYHGNTFSNNDQHVVLLGANESQVVGNIFDGISAGWRRWGGLALSGTNILVANNNFTNMPIGIELFGGEFLFGVPAGNATDPKLFTNQFCNIPEPIRTQPMASGVQEQGTEVVCPFQPPLRDLHVPTEYSTIQAAVNAAAAGDTIHIAAGDYYEQIVIANKRLTLVGEPGAVLHARTGMTDTLRPYGWLFVPVLGVFRSDVAVTGMTFEGHRLGNLYNGLFGIYYLGSAGRVENCTVRGFRASTSTAFGTAGFRTQNAVSIGTPAVAVGVLNSTFADNEVSMHIRGEPALNPTLLRTIFTLEANTVTGMGALPTAFDGIVIRNGAAGVVRGNIITDHLYTGTGEPFASGIAAHDDNARNRMPPALIPLLPVRYEGNTFSNNNEHLVIIAGNESQVINNIFRGTGPDEPRWGALAISGTNVVVANNDFSDTPLGIYFFGDEQFFAGWPPISHAVDPMLLHNWFCNIIDHTRIQSPDTMVQERGTEFCENGPFRPIFQSISASHSLTVRSWHGQPVVIEGSSDLQNWLPVHTNAMALPTVQNQDSSGPGASHRFYRAVVP